MYQLQHLEYNLDLTLFPMRRQINTFMRSLVIFNRYTQHYWRFISISIPLGLRFFIRIYGWANERIGILSEEIDMHQTILNLTTSIYLRVRATTPWHCELFSEPPFGRMGSACLKLYSYNCIHFQSLLIV